MRIFITIIVFLCVVNESNAQVYLQNIQGTIIKAKPLVDVVGSQFLNDEFINGKVVLANGDEYESVPIQYSTYEDELYFRNPTDGSSLSFVVPVKSFSLLGVTYMRGLPAIDNFTENSFYALIAEGKATLFIKKYKTITENKTYGSANTEKKFEDNKLYFVFKDGKMMYFKPSKKGLLEIFADKAAEIEAYLKKQKVDLKSNNELAGVFKYYSSL